MPGRWTVFHMVKVVATHRGAQLGVDTETEREKERERESEREREREREREGEGERERASRSLIYFFRACVGHVLYGLGFVGASAAFFVYCSL